MNLRINLLTVFVGLLAMTACGSESIDDRLYFTVSSYLSKSEVEEMLRDKAFDIYISAKKISKENRSGNTIYYVSFKEPLQSIIKDEFSGCESLTTVIIPKSVTSIEDGAFSKCKSLKLVFIPNSVTSIGEKAFSECKSLTSVTISDSVTSIGEKAFQGCQSLTSLTIPNSVTSIGNLAFSDCKALTSVTIPSSVTSLGYGAISGSESLTITISKDNPLTLTDILDSGIIKRNKIESISWKYSSYVYDDAFIVIDSTLVAVLKGKAKGRISIPNSVTSIGEKAFQSCQSLTSVTIPNSVTSIGKEAFDNCQALTSVTIPNSVISIGNMAFHGCIALTSVTIPNSVTSIGDMAFSYCTALTSVTIPNSVISIGDSAFRLCESLTSITIPYSVTSIGREAFAICKSLTSISIPNPNPNLSIGNDAFTSTFEGLASSNSNSGYRAEDGLPLWVYGTWSCTTPNGTETMKIDKNGIWFLSYGHTDYGSYSYQDGTITAHFPKDGGLATTMPLDFPNKRIRYGGGYYWHKTSD